MGYLPIFLDVTARACLVIGGGQLAEAKVEKLLDAGAAVTIISPEVSDAIKSLAVARKICHLARVYQPGDLRGNCVVYLATTDVEEAARVTREAHGLGVPLNVPDNPRLSTFISPATFRRGDLQIAISTGGASPAVARMLREQLEQQIGPDYTLVLKIMRCARQFLGTVEPDQGARACTLRSLAAALLESIGALDYQLIDRTLRSYLNAGLIELGFSREAEIMTEATRQRGE